MIIATRALSVGLTRIPITIHAPERAKSDWVCRFEIGWPDEIASRHGSGVDAVQAVVHALQMIGAEIYTSPLHRSGKLQWLGPDEGYGFPVPGSIHDLLIGDDAKFL